MVKFSSIKQNPIQLLILAVLCCSFAAFQNQKEKKAWRLNGYAQGTTFHITYYAADSVVSIKQADSILKQIDSSLSLYKPYSLINKFNASDAGIAVDCHFAKVVKRSLEVFQHTEGTFDITVKPLVAAWGFGVKKKNTVPDSAEVASILRCVGSEKLHLEENFLKKDHPCVQIDVNGIAQGYSVDVLAGFLEANNIKDYLVELGGEIRVKGLKRPGNERMRIGIEAAEENPFGSTPIRRILALSEGAITTSGNYRQYHQAGSKRISHLIDPKTGYPYQNELISVTVFAKDAITADAYDNALMGMGLKQAFRFIEKHPEIAAYFIYRKPDGAAADTASSGFPKFLDGLE